MPRRRSIFSFSLRSTKNDPEPSTSTSTDFPPTHSHRRGDAASDTVSLPDSSDPSARCIPRQWAPNRLATVYVTPSEQNLYLAAMASLDQPAPPLHLWSDPAPQLGPMRQQTPLDPTPPTIASPVPGIRAHARLPLSPKLVTSPTLPLGGLSVREEFRHTHIPPVQPTQHALLALSDEAQIRFHNFPHATLAGVNEALKEAWPRGVVSQHPSLESLERRESGKQGDTWIVVLRGRVWKRSGNAELETIRLMLALLSVLGVHGWQLVEKMQASGLKYDHQNLLFAYSPQTASMPPAFFALSIPLPDRLSLISPPNKVTPALISAIRTAIMSHSHGKQRGPDALGAPEGRQSPPRSAIEWDAWKGGIKLEGWVHPGVYRFWIGGLRRWLSGAVKWNVVEKLHPPLILSLINALGDQHFNLLTSLPLLPLQKGRDILIFQSTPMSGLSVNDTWREQPSVPSTVAGKDEPVLIWPEDAMPARGEIIPAELHGTHVTRRAAGPADDRANTQTRQGAHEHLFQQEVGPRPQGRHKRFASVDTNAYAPHAGTRPGPGPAQLQTLQQADSHGRLASIDSDRPLLPDTATGPRKRNLLLKKESLRRNGTGSSTASGADSSRARAGQNAAADASASATAAGPGKRSKLWPITGSGSAVAAAGATAKGDANARRSMDTDTMYRSDDPEQVHLRSRHGIGSEFTMDGEGGLGGNWSMVDLPQGPQGQSSLGLSMYAPQGQAPQTYVQLGLPPPPPIPARNRPDSPARDGTPGYTYSSAGLQPTVGPRPSFDSDASASVYHDATAAGYPGTAYQGQGQFNGQGQASLPPSAFSPTHARDTPRELHIANPTPPPLSAVGGGGFEAAREVPNQDPYSGAGAPHAPPPILGGMGGRTSHGTSGNGSGDGSTPDLLSAERGPEVPLGAQLDLPLQTARPRVAGRGRDALVDVGSGIGVQSVAGSVGYMGGPGASRSVLGVTPAQSMVHLPQSQTQTQTETGAGPMVPPPLPPRPEGYAYEAERGAAAGQAQAGTDVVPVLGPGSGRTGMGSSRTRVAMGP